MKILVDTEKLAGMLEKLLLTVGEVQIGGPGMPSIPNPDEPGSIAPEYNSQKTYRLEWKPNHNRAFTWLPRTGADYGGQIKFTFNNGAPPIVVPDATDNYGRDNGAPAYFCGTKNRKEESNGNRASIFGATGFKATEVTIHYNR